jgi:hypothetical protein
MYCQRDGCEIMSYFYFSRHFFLNHHSLRIREYSIGLLAAYLYSSIDLLVSFVKVLIGLFAFFIDL